MKKYLSIFLVTCLIISMLSILSLRSYADVPVNQIVSKIGSTWNVPFAWNYNQPDYYYVINDPTGLEICTISTPYYYWTENQTTFKRGSGEKTFTYVLNNILGVIPNPNNLSGLFQGFSTSVGFVDSINEKYMKSGLYDSNDNFYGYCLNDISGCYYDGIALNTDSITDNGNYVNNVKNYYDSTDINVPDYFVFYPLSNNYILSNYVVALSSSQLEDFNNIAESNNFLYGVYHNDSDNTTFFQGSYNKNGNILGYLSDVNYLVNDTNSVLTDWNSFCKNCVQNNECLGTDLISISNRYAIHFYPYDSNDIQIVNYSGYNFTNSSSGPYTLTSNNYWLLSTNYDYMPFGFDSITFYKNSNIKIQLDSNLYYPSVYYTDAYKNYDVNQNHTINTTIQIVDSSISNNESIYNDSNDSFYNYYDNGYYDQSSSISNVTNITNNYYGNGSEDNPDNPDDNTLEAILAAILRFFNAIGDIIGTVLAGLVNMISSVLESIAELTSDITNLSDVFSSLLAWLPDPVPQVLGVGISLIIIAGVIKFIRG